MQKFVRRYFPEVVEAVCWDGTLEDELIAWATGCRAYVPGSIPHSLLGGKGTVPVPSVRITPQGESDGIVTAAPGKWIIKNDRNELFVMSGDVFKGWFEPVPDAAKQICDDLVAAFIIGEDPKSVNFESIAQLFEQAKKVVGPQRVHELYRMHRPERLKSYQDDEAHNFALIR